jgi:hypothetical protein
VSCFRKMGVLFLIGCSLQSGHRNDGDGGGIENAAGSVSALLGELDSSKEDIHFSVSAKEHTHSCSFSMDVLESALPRHIPFTPLWVRPHRAIVSGHLTILDLSQLMDVPLSNSFLGKHGCPIMISRETWVSHHDRLWSDRRWLVVGGQWSAVSGRWSVVGGPIEISDDRSGDPC